MILPLQMFESTDQNQMSPVYLFIYLFIYLLFIQIQILIGFQPNRFVTKYSKKKVYGTN